MNISTAVRSIASTLFGIIWIWAFAVSLMFFSFVLYLIFSGRYVYLFDSSTWQVFSALFVTMEMVMFILLSVPIYKTLAKQSSQKKEFKDYLVQGFAILFLVCVNGFLTYAFISDFISGPVTYTGAPEVELFSSRRGMRYQVVVTNGRELFIRKDDYEDLEKMTDSDTITVTYLDKTGIVLEVSSAD